MLKGWIPTDVNRKALVCLAAVWSCPLFYT